MSRQAIIERERRLRTWVIVTAVLPLLLFIAGTAIQSEAGTTGTLPTESLRAIAENEGPVMTGAIVSSLGVLLLLVPLVYLFRAADARSDRMLSGLIGLCVLGPALFAIQGAMLASARSDIAEQFAEQEQGVGDIYSLARNLLENSGAYTTAQLVGSIGLLALVFAMVYTPLWAYRVGLLTRLHGTIGMALAAVLMFGSAVNPALSQVTFPALLVWFMYFGLVLSGRTRSGRPPAWDAGQAIPWPAPGQEPVALAGANGEVIEGDASEIPGVGENPNAARRERAKRRKRKRRR